MTLMNLFKQMFPSTSQTLNISGTPSITLPVWLYRHKSECDITSVINHIITLD